MLIRSEGASLQDIVDHLEQMINMGRPTIITGDLNVCLDKEPRNLLNTVLIDLGFDQLVKSPTHVRGGRIDHAYARDPESHLSNLHLTRYSPYYSDHDSLCLSFNIKVQMSCVVFKHTS